MNNVSKRKIATGYILLLVVLFLSLFFVYREMENMMSINSRDVLRTDTLIELLREKDANTISLLRTLNEENQNMISAHEVERFIAEQDTLIARQRVQRRVTARRDTMLTQPPRKGFFRRLGEVFVPPKKDSTLQVQDIIEVSTDTIIDDYNPIDSLQERLRQAATQKRTTNNAVQHRKRSMQRIDQALTNRIDSILKGYEQETLMKARIEMEQQNEVRQHSFTVIASIAVVAVLLAAIFLFIIWRDVSRSNHYRSRLEEANRFAEELLDTREKLMLAITHDFKAPLGSIMGYADLLSRITSDERQRFYLDNMKASSHHLLRLVTDLLDFHRLDLKKVEVDRVAFHPARLLDEICVSFQPMTSGKGLSLQFSIDPQLKKTFVGDPLRLRQIINNLLSNAVKFTSSGGITVEARFVSASGDAIAVDDKSAINKEFAGNHLLLSVSDTGKGMEPSDRERIFQVFTRLPGAQGEEGFGLGLSIVQMLVQLLEARIDVESEVGVGSKFTLRVPLYPVGADCEPKNTPLLPRQPLPSSSALLPLNVLLIDDDRIHLTLTASMLTQLGISSTSCLTPDELFDALRNYSYDVLLTDVQMPAISGFDLLKLMRSSNIRQALTIPVVAVTARSHMKRDEFLQHGFAGALHKPFAQQELLEEIRCSVGSNQKSFFFEALTAFSSDDAVAAKSIIQSFVTETRINAECLRKAVDSADVSTIAAMGHKMQPIFTLLRADALVALLKELDAFGGQPFDEEISKKAHLALTLIEEVVSKAEEILE